MNKSNDPGDRYGHLAATLHWLTVVVLIAIFSIAFYMDTLERAPGSSFGYFVTLHKNLGITLFLLMFLRLGWRLVRPAPRWPANVPTWQRRLADGIHHLLYLLLFLQPIIGYLSSSFSGYKTSYWGIPLPQWAAKHEELNEFLTDMHEVIAFVLLIAIVIHVAGALAHAFIPRLQSGSGRMPPFPKRN